MGKNGSVRFEIAASVAGRRGEGQIAPTLIHPAWPPGLTNASATPFSALLALAATPAGAAQRLSVRGSRLALSPRGVGTGREGC